MCYFIEGVAMKCRWCGAELDIIRRNIFSRRPRETRWVCYGCRIKRKCKIPKDDPDGCWIFEGSKTKGGYGVLWMVEKGRNLMRHAHRIAYAVWCGPIKTGWAVEHHDFCGTRLCCNPRHLKLVQQPLAIGHQPIEIDFSAGKHSERMREAPKGKPRY